MKYNNIILTIIPENINGEIKNLPESDCVRASWCYLHGKLENENGYDIFSLLKSEILPEHKSEKWISDDFPKGEYECICFDKPCTFFIWHCERHNHGLVVLNSDIKAFQYAKTAYLNKEISI